MLKKLFIPLCSGEGNFLYPFEIGSKTILSATLLKLNIALFTGSKGSYISSSIVVVSKSSESVFTSSASLALEL